MPVEKHTAKEFVEVWQTSKSLVEAARRLGLSRRTACARAYRMRQYGVPLKLFNAETNWEALAQFAREVAK